MKFEWKEVHQQAFDCLKTELATTPVLSCPDFNLTFHLQTDASNIGLGNVLFEITPLGEQVVAYASRTLHKSERNYSATEKECLGVVWGIQKKVLSGRISLCSNYRSPFFKMVKDNRLTIRSTSPMSIVIPTVRF